MGFWIICLASCVVGAFIGLACLAVRISDLEGKDTATEFYVQREIAKHLMENHVRDVDEWLFPSVTIRAMLAHLKLEAVKVEKKEGWEIRKKGKEEKSNWTFRGPL